MTVARDNTFIVLRPQHGQPEISKELGVHLWHALASERGIQKAISTLAQGGLEEMPEFAIVHGLKNALHVIVRGNFSVLLLNHDGRYSSVDSEGAATWREYAELPAAEFCIRGVPGLTVRGTEEFYLASGVSRVSVICSLGWDDPDQPMNAVEASETGAIAEVELTPDADAQALSEAVAARVGHTASGSTAASAMSAVSPGALTLPGGIPEISEDYESAPHELFRILTRNQLVLARSAQPARTPRRRIQRRASSGRPKRRHTRARAART
ncbi:hypothetical protein [Timonella sp. A28]|uniref:hypothetical protein n=1 Tax=Timonella sp. A28 TaxID=3442640 RepID=UPI003EBD2955